MKWLLVSFLLLITTPAYSNDWFQPNSDHSKTMMDAINAARPKPPGYDYDRAEQERRLRDLEWEQRRLEDRQRRLERRQRGW
ncbi:MAG TPA: hypothetical protein DCY12_04235 [Candidatus Atribacteria bacterium]|nr:hypothetical protein [Candidatus Atribacteria bacterium]